MAQRRGNNENRNQRVRGPPAPRKERTEEEWAQLRAQIAVRELRNGQYAPWFLGPYREPVVMADAEARAILQRYAAPRQVVQEPVQVVEAGVANLVPAVAEEAVALVPVEAARAADQVPEAPKLLEPQTWVASLRRCYKAFDDEMFDKLVFVSVLLYAIHLVGLSAFADILVSVALNLMTFTWLVAKVVVDMVCAWVGPKFAPVYAMLVVIIWRNVPVSAVYHLGGEGIAYIRWFLDTFQAVLQWYDGEIFPQVPGELSLDHLVSCLYFTQFYHFRKRLQQVPGLYVVTHPFLQIAGWWWLLKYASFGAPQPWGMCVLITLVSFVIRCTLVRADDAGEMVIQHLKGDIQTEENALTGEVCSWRLGRYLCAALHAKHGLMTNTSPNERIVRRECPALLEALPYYASLRVEQKFSAINYAAKYFWLPTLDAINKSRLKQSPLAQQLLAYVAQPMP